jgi:uncharacterized protein (DUF1330 family)
MSAYVVVFLDSVSDPAELAEYRRIGSPTVKAAGGRFVVRGTSGFEVREGDQPVGVFVLEFPDLATAKTWYDSPTYQEALSHRQKGAKCRAVIVDGFNPVT